MSRTMPPTTRADETPAIARHGRLRSNGVWTTVAKVAWRAARRGALRNVPAVGTCGRSPRQRTDDEPDRHRLRGSDGEKIALQGAI